MQQLGICDYQYRVKCEASLSVNPPGSKQPDMPQASESSAESTSQAPGTKILYMDNMNNIENPGKILPTFTSSYDRHTRTVRQWKL